MARKEDKQPQYLPLIVKAKLHTGGRDYEKIKEELKGQGFTCKQMKGMVREGNYFDGIVLYLSKWNWDNHESWHRCSSRLKLAPLQLGRQGRQRSYAGHI